MKQWVEETLKQLNLVESMNQPEGFNREGYTKKEDESIEEFKRIAENLGMELQVDAAGSVIARWHGLKPSDPAVATGSHLDTVISGGGYDGVAGVLCGLGAVKKLKETGFQPVSPIEVICFRSEESSRFGVSTIGSKAMSGILDLAIGDVKDIGGTTIQQAVEDRGFDWNKIQSAERKKEEIKSFIELHIEQGTQIEEYGKDYGVVHGVACPIRLNLEVQGKAGHTGTTPMNSRQDAMVAFAPIVSFVQKKALEMSEENENPVVATVSKVELKPNSMNVIPSTVIGGVDIRSVDDRLKAQLVQAIEEKCRNIEKQFGVKILISTLVNNDSVHLDEIVAKKLEQAGKELGYSSHHMNSGAGHDVMNMAKKWPAGLIFIPCKDGLSHHPLEHASIDDLVIGIDLLSQYMKMEAGNSLET